MKGFGQKICGKSGRRAAFTLPEVIVAFSVLVLVIVSASNVLAVVMRTNADNVNSLVAYGLAQEGLENMRFIRDSNFVLGLDFDGTAKGKPSVWVDKLFDKGFGSSSNFILINNDRVGSTCTQANLSNCLPVSLKKVDGDVDSLVKAASTLVYRVGGKDEVFSFVQSSDGQPANSVATQYHRVIHVQPFKVNPVVGVPSDYDSIRVSSMVFWIAGGIEKKVVLTSELTDWK